MFISRENELASLNNLYASDKFEFFILYGRRRVGKTALLQEFCKDKNTIFFSCEQTNYALNLEKITKQISTHYDIQDLPCFESLAQAITFIDKLQANSRLVLIIDEFPYIAKNNSLLLSQLQHLIDLKLQHESKLFIILCGSYLGFMENEVLGYKSPLYGRRSGQLKLQPLDYYESSKFLPKLNALGKLQVYACLGGIPMYLNMYRQNLSFEQNIDLLFSKADSFFNNEPLMLLKQEVKEVAIYNSIIYAIATGASKANEIATKTKEDVAKCLKYINTLCELNILQKETPYLDKASSRKTTYSICDPMLNFYFRFVFFHEASTITQDLKDNFDQYMSSQFRVVCKQFLLQQNCQRKLPFVFSSIGSLWNYDCKSRKDVKIDLVASCDSNFMFGDCIWTNEKVDSEILDSLKQKSKRFIKGLKKEIFMLFSKSGFTDALIEEAENSPNILLYEWYVENGDTRTLANL